MTDFTIEIESGNDSGMNEDEATMTLGMSEFLDIMKLLKSSQLQESYQRNLRHECNVCNSYSLDTPVFYDIIAMLISYMDSSEFEQDFEAWSRVYESLLDIRDNLIYIVYFTDKEWLEYYDSGIRNEKLIYDPAGELLTDSDGNHFTYISDKVILRLDERCPCKTGEG